jgi:hypothetical protein
MTKKTPTLSDMLSHYLQEREVTEKNRVRAYELSIQFQGESKRLEGVIQGLDVAIAITRASIMALEEQQTTEEPKL